MGGVGSHSTIYEEFSRLCSLPPVIAEILCATDARAVVFPARRQVIVSLGGVQVSFTANLLILLIVMRIHSPEAGSSDLLFATNHPFYFLRFHSNTWVAPLLRGRSAASLNVLLAITGLNWPAIGRRSW